MVIIIITVVTQGFRVPSESRGQLRGGILIHSGIFEAIGVISFAFVCHHNSLLIYGSLRKPTIDRFTKVTHYSTGISLAACLVMAFTGYLTFGSKTEGNVLNNFPSDNLMVNIARLFFGLNMLTTLPLEAFVCREVMNNYWFPDEPYQPNRHLIFTTALVITAMMLSLLTCDLGIVFELFGATSACALAYILPPLCYIKLAKRSKQTYLAMAVVTFGCAVMAISLIKTMAEMSSNNPERQAQCNW
jgi:sodium-coupled neutral amino acid transporter 11